MKDGRTNQIIRKLINNIENGQSVPLSTGKVMVNKDETILMLRELESIVNAELKTYRDVNDKRGKIITEAKKEAEEIISEAERTASRIRVTKRVSSIGSTFKADKLDDEERMALRTANDIYAASLIYTDEMLTEVNDLLDQAYNYVNNQYGRMLADLEEKARLIANNKAELMSNLKELSNEERYEQILELSQLLSNELYSERQRMKEMEYEEQRREEKKAAKNSAAEDKTDSAFTDSAFSDSAFTDSAFTDSAFTDSAFVNDKSTDELPVDEVKEKKNNTKADNDSNALSETSETEHKSYEEEAFEDIENRILSTDNSPYGIGEIYEI